MYGSVKITPVLAKSFLLLGLLATAGQAWAEAGRIMYASGEANLIRDREIPATKGMAVETGDTLVTGANGRIQLLMADGDRIALRPNTRFSIDEYSGPTRVRPGEPVPETRPASWRSFYSLAKGGFRTLTQSLGQRDAASYQVRTPVATIGIRGTDYTLLYCPEGCAAYQKTAGNDVKVDGMQASVFRESAGSRLLFAALGVNWVQEFLKAQEQDSGGGSEGGGELQGGVSDGEIDVNGPFGQQSVSNDQYFSTDGSGFSFLDSMPEGLQDQSTGGGEGEWSEQVGEGEGEGEGEFSTRTSPTEGDQGEGGETTDGPLTDGADGGTGTGGTGDTSTPQQTITTTDGGDLSGGGTPPPPASPFRGLADAEGPSTQDSGEGPTPLPGGVNALYAPIAVTVDGGGRATAFSTSGQFQDEGGNTVTVIAKSALVPGEGSSVNDGFDLDGGTGANSATGLRWGRWTGMYQDTVTENGQVVASRVVDLGDSSLHFIYGPDTGTPPVIQIEGSYSYTLVGNTNPTDNHGHVGVLGFADFEADFSGGNADITHSLGVNINGQTWSADAFCPACIGSDGAFGGSYDSVTITDENGCGSSGCAGDGEFAGFFTPGGSASAPPPGAGMGYHLTDAPSEGNTEVSGAAAFGNPQSAPSVDQ